MDDPGAPDLEVIEDGDTVWRFERSFLTSNWTCIWGRGCQGILPEPTPHLVQGCCSFGAEVDESEAPTIAELGIPGFDFSLWGGIFAPAGTPAEIVARLNREITRVITQPEMQAQMAREGSDVIRTTPEEFGRFVQAESGKYAEILKAVNYR